MHLLHASTIVLVLAAVSLLPGCVRSRSLLDHGSETAPEGLTALNAKSVPESSGRVSFSRQIKPILENKCVACHSDPLSPWGFSLESKKRAFAAGPGGPRIIPGDPDASSILSFASTHENTAAMPLVGNRLTETESKLLRQWIAEGAFWPNGPAGALKPGEQALQPESAKLRKEWKTWLEKDEPNP